MLGSARIQKLGIDHRKRVMSGLLSLCWPCDFHFAKIIGISDIIIVLVAIADCH